MKRPSFLQGLGMALLLSFSGGVLFSLSAGLLPSDVALRAVIALLGLVYVLYLLSRSSTRVGRLTTVALWTVMFAASWFAVNSLFVYLLVHIGALWLVRSLYYYASLLSALLDLGLCGMSLATAVWAASHTGNIFLVLWCFFVGQALFVGIPASMRRQREAGQQGPADDEIFQRAHRTAEAAVRRLFLHN